MIRKIQIMVVFAVLPLLSLQAEDIVHSSKVGIDLAYHTDDNKGYGAENHGILPSYTPVLIPNGFTALGDDTGRQLGNGWGALELQGVVSHSIKIPVLQGESGLTKDNNITFTGSISLSPVTLSGSVHASWTPIAFLQFDVGYLGGTGWDIGFFNGVGLNSEGVMNNDSFPGLVSNIWASATFQFDLAALVPGDWTHIIVMVNSKFLYKDFSAAGADDPWMWLADNGENYNGFEYHGSYFLGYQIPPIITLGFLVETKENLGYNRYRSIMKDNGSGSDFVYVVFGPVFNLAINKNHNLTILTQFKNEREYSAGSIHYNNFLNRQYKDWYIEFSRVAVSYRFSF